MKTSRASWSSGENIQIFCSRWNPIIMDRIMGVLRKQLTTIFLSHFVAKYWPLESRSKDMIVMTCDWPFIVLASDCWLPSQPSRNPPHQSTGLRLSNHKSNPSLIIFNTNIDQQSKYTSTASYSSQHLNITKVQSLIIDSSHKLLPTIVESFSWHNSRHSRKRFYVALIISSP